MPILNYTTSVAVDRSVAEIQRILANHGAEEVSVVYSAGKVAGVRFVLRLGTVLVRYQMPARVDGVLAALKKARVSRSLQQPDHAQRVAWRILKDWCEAQMALVESEQARMTEVFLPYATRADGVTVYELFEKNAERLLTSGEASE